MFRSLLTASVIACALAFGIAGTGAAFTSDGQISKIGKATTDAGKATVKGTKEVAKKAGDVTEDAAKKTVTTTKNTGKTAEGAVTPKLTSARCKDGTVQTGKTRTAACTGHGGVKQ